jgi:GDP-4-dehydro-6-deoxy-D-mannose reductase
MKSPHLRILITGHSGFVGQNLLARAPSDGDQALFEFVTLPDNFDLRSAATMQALMSGVRFDHVIHLAAQSNVPASLDDPVATFDVNVMGSVRLLQILRANRFAGRFLYVSSGDVYGIVRSDELPVSEATPVRPVNPYAASKVAAETTALSWARQSGFEVIVARPFNHIGPSQGTGFAIPRFSDALARIKLGLLPPVLTTGRLDVTRDFLDVGDVINAYLALLIKGRNGEIYNICSGIERRLDDLLKQLIVLSGLDIELRQDSALMRPADLPRMVGSADKLRRDSGWSPQVPFSDTLQSVFAYFLQLHQKS